MHAVFTLLNSDIYVDLQNLHTRAFVSKNIPDVDIFLVVYGRRMSKSTHIKYFR
jgi:hypothetical protein